jgi:hypothetical protein
MPNNPANRPGCSRPQLYEDNNPHVGCTDDWCVADPLPKHVDNTDREALRRVKLGLAFRKIPMRPALRRAWDSVK